MNRVTALHLLGLELDENRWIGGSHRWSMIACDERRGLRVLYLWRRLEHVAF